MAQSLFSSTSDQITFTDYAVNDNSGITYRRVESPRNALFDLIKQQPVLTQENGPLAPFKPRGAPGVAIFDYDGDGDLDLYVTNGPGTPNSLYANQLQQTGQVHFVGVAYGDIDNDGDSDLLVLGTGMPNLLFENQGDGTFIDITEESDIGGEATYATAASLGDVNGDGLLDIAVANSTQSWDDQIPFVTLSPRNEHNQLLLNQGDNTFLDVSDSSGFTNLSSLTSSLATITWAIALVDYDLDGDLDIIHADDQAAIPSTQRGGIDHGYIQLFNNDGTGTFTNVTEIANLNLTGSWMGLTFGDFNADGNLDIFATNLGDYTGSILPLAPDVVASQWFLGQGDGTFVDAGLGNLGATPFGWGASAFDYDNDSDTDIVFHGGLDAAFYVDASNPGSILQNDGTANFSYDLNALADSTNHTRRNVQGVAVGDLNQDGFPDIVYVSTFDTPDPIPIQPYPIPLESPLDSIAGFIPTFLPTATPGEFVWSGLEFPDGTLSVELSSADNGNNWVKLIPLGTVELTEAGRVNRDGIGAVFSFTPTHGQTVLHPILGGASHASQNSLEAIFGLGQETMGVVEVLWPGGTRNRLYGVQAEAQLVFPEIPVSFDGEFEDINEYQSQLDGAISELIATDVLTVETGDRFFASGVRAYLEENALTVSLLMGAATEDALIGSANDEHLYGRSGDDTVAGGLGNDMIFGNGGDDVLRGDLNERQSGSTVGGDDLIYGGAGNDRIGGKAGNDTLLGEAGDDQIWGDDGDDILRGGIGNDTLIGDNFSGGQGHDIFVLAIGEGTDTIVDFEVGEDIIGLADGLTFGQLTLTENEIRVGEEVLATVENVSTTEIDVTNFIVV